MEDILASIRRILSEDESPAAPAPASAERPGQAESKPDEKNVLVLDPSMMVGEPRPGAPLEPRMSADPPVEPPRIHEPPRAPEPKAPAPARQDNGNLVAPEAAAAAASSVGTLVRTLSERSAHVYQGGPTLEDMVREELRPILKQWLDVYLPPIVERLVRLEIERVVGRSVP